MYSSDALCWTNRPPHVAIGLQHIDTLTDIKEIEKAPKYVHWQLCAPHTKACLLPPTLHCSYKWNESEKNKTVRLNSSDNRVWGMMEQESREDEWLMVQEKENSQENHNWNGEEFYWLGTHGLIERQHLGSLKVSLSLCFCWLSVCVYVCPRGQGYSGSSTCVSVYQFVPLIYTCVSTYAHFNKVVLSSRYNKQPPLHRFAQHCTFVNVIKQPGNRGDSCPCCWHSKCGSRWQ